jgi:hypothetical protein
VDFSLEVNELLVVSKHNSKRSFASIGPIDVVKLNGSFLFVVVFVANEDCLRFGDRGGDDEAVSDSYFVVRWESGYIP